MKSIYFISFCLLSSLELAADNSEYNTSVMVNMSATAKAVSDVSVSPDSISKTLIDIFDLRDISNDDKDIDNVTITYQTNVAGQKLALTSDHAENDKFYLHHSSYTPENNLQLLLKITQENGTTIIPSVTALTSTTSDISVRDSTHTISVKLQPDNNNAANAGRYTTTLTIVWMST